MLFSTVLLTEEARLRRERLVAGMVSLRIVKANQRRNVVEIPWLLAGRSSVRSHRCLISIRLMPSSIIW